MPSCARRCLLYYYGDESEIDLDAHGEREFSEWAWMPLEQLPDEACLPFITLAPCSSPCKAGGTPMLACLGYQFCHPMSCG